MTTSFMKVFGSGMLGDATAASRRYQRRSMWAAALFAVIMFGLGGIKYEIPASKYLAALTPGLVFLYICMEFRRYMSSMDEMLRRIHLESIAWTYLTALVVAMFLGGIGGVLHWNINPMWVIFLEPVRALWLYATARRY
jgi:hypothetical protein